MAFVFPVVAMPVAALTAPSVGGSLQANAIVGFKTRSVDLSGIQSLGATVLATSDSLGLAAVYTPNLPLFAKLASRLSNVAWVDDNDAVALSASGWDSSGWDSSGWDASSWDASGWDASSWDSSSWDASGWDASGWDASSWDASGWDASSWDASGWDASSWDASGWDASGWDASGWDASGWDASGWDASGWDGSAMTSIGRKAGSPGTDPLVPWQWGLAAVGARHADVSATAGSTVICVVDSGVDASHPDLSGRVLPGRDFVNRDHDAHDDGGHGTHVAGIAAAIAKNGVGLAGLSNAKILPVKVLDKNGVGTEADLAFGIDWCRKKGADVISMSLGTPEKSKAIHRAVVDAFAKGIVLVASAGNTGPSCDCVQYPAAYPQVISVAALTPGGTPAPFSSASHGVDFAAPGYAIVSTLPGNKYGTMSGTSQAAPFVSALAALLVARGADGPTVAQTLKDSALDLGPAGRDIYTGYGAINFRAALAG